MGCFVIFFLLGIGRSDFESSDHQFLTFKTTFAKYVFLVHVVTEFSIPLSLWSVSDLTQLPLNVWGEVLSL